MYWPKEMISSVSKLNLPLHPADSSCFNPTMLSLNDKMIREEPGGKVVISSYPETPFWRSHLLCLEVRFPYCREIGESWHFQSPASERQTDCSLSAKIWQGLNYAEKKGGPYHLHSMLYIFFLCVLVMPQQSSLPKYWNTILPSENTANNSFLDKFNPRKATDLNGRVADWAKSQSI